MQRRHAVVVPHSQSNLQSLIWIAIFALLAILYVPHADAQGPEVLPFGSQSTENPRYLARILNDSPEEVASALRRAESLYTNGQLPNDLEPIALVLHGPEVEIFFKDKYDEYKEIVDLAARLSAFGVVDVRVCETQTGIMGRHRSSLHSFIGTVQFGPSEVKRLLDQQNYVYF